MTETAKNQVAGWRVYRLYNGDVTIGFDEWGKRTGTVVPMPLSTETGSFLFEHDLNAAGIGHNLNSVPIYLHANRHVGQVDFHFTSFQLETNYDRLAVSDNFADGSWSDQWFTGNLGAMTVSAIPCSAPGSRSNSPETLSSSELP